MKAFGDDISKNKKVKKASFRNYRTKLVTLSRKITSFPKE